MEKKTLVIVVVGACVGVWAIGSFVAPTLRAHDESLPDTVSDHVFHERTKTFATADGAPRSGDGEGLFVLPGWVPKDATNVKVKARTDGNAKLIRFTLGSAPLKPSGEACSAGSSEDGPTMEAAWWPGDVGTGDGRPECSGQYAFQVAVKDHRVYAWSNGDLAQS